MCNKKVCVLVFTKKSCGYQKSICQKKQAWTWHKHEEYVKNAVGNCARTLSCAFMCKLARINDYIETMRVVPLKRVSKIYVENAKQKSFLFTKSSN